ncbi:ShlB/FhaC/HecB family hemolysin secretion/activation protein [Parvularcula sp. LCG005]|uniref:ShlB/FhaC/HecB family hemolysin secretion/activation protein n=1 Tax=Parvularcula sp. LCG005 TaxID=3078805 RepID=UPI00294389CF|nr:ShlB/FhaC/HecB family hemolysin secretion/activation protein [Parvularcula sp. LCG005]WOI52405.1 ShlB/FhaC/HecB family hemolysin secretion/activation protein [Parvularcula sp. LCG005]
MSRNENGLLRRHQLKLAGLLILGLAGAMVPAKASAQDLPPGADPSTINEEMRRRQQETRDAGTSQIDDVVTNAQSFDFYPLADTGVSFELTAVTFDPSVFLTIQQLENIAAPYIGNTVTFSDLNDIVAQVNSLYDDGGYLTARAMLRPQRIEDGQVKISLVEGVVEDVTVDGVTTYGADYVTARIKAPPGEVVDLPALEADLLRFNRLNNAKLVADLKPGDAFGTTDIILQLQEPKRYQLDLFVDNNGFDSTGEFEGGAVGRRYSLLTDDDQLNGFVVGAGGALSGSIAYNRPIGFRGARSGLSYVRGRTDVINGPFKALSVEGTSDTVSVNTSLPLLFRRGRFVGTDFSISRTAAETTVDSVKTSETKISMAELGLNADIVAGKTMALFRTSVVTAEADEQLFDDRRNITLLRGSAYLSRQLSPKVRGSLDLQWQHTADEDLPGTLEFQLGGANSVRAFDPGTVAGDSGYFAKLQMDREMIRAETYSLDMFTFVDVGQVESLFPTTQLSAAGVGARWRRGSRVTLSGTVGVPLDDGDLPEQSDVRAFVNLTVRAF